MHPDLRDIPGLAVASAEPLSRHTRFGIGGPASLLADAATETALAGAAEVLGSRAGGEPCVVIGGGTNLVVSDQGFAGVVLRYTKQSVEIEDRLVRVAAGTVLQELVDRTIAAGLRGLETMTGIPGWVGGAIYGNAGAYGHSIHERVESVRFLDRSAKAGPRSFREIGNAECGFRYRESAFKRHKEWIVVSAVLRLNPADPAELRATAGNILKIRNEKYPPTMRCAGSIFKNCLFDELPQNVRARVPGQVIREGKVPSAYFLEQVGAKGMVNGGVRVADYHANLIYNAGGGTAAQIRELIGELKKRVREQYGIELEEEVQYV